MAPQDGSRGGDREETVRAPQGKRPGLRPGGSASRGREARKSLVFARPRAAPRGVYAAGKAHLSGTGDELRNGCHFTLAFSHFLYFSRNNSIYNIIFLLHIEV